MRADKLLQYHHHLELTITLNYAFVPVLALTAAHVCAKNTSDRRPSTICTSVSAYNSVLILADSVSPVLALLDQAKGDK